MRRPRPRCWRQGRWRERGVARSWRPMSEVRGWKTPARDHLGLMVSQITQGDKAADQGDDEEAGEQGQAPLDEAAHRLAEAPEQGRHQEEAEAARDQRGEGEGGEIEFEGAAGDGDSL